MAEQAKVSAVDEARRRVVAAGAEVVSECLSALVAMDEGWTACSMSDVFTAQELADLGAARGRLRLLLASLEARRGEAVQPAGGVS